jgi:hypothetical protein
VGSTLATGALSKEDLDKVQAALGRLQSAAPSEIKGDVDTVAAGIEKLAAVFAKYDYDPAKLAQASADFAEFTSAIQDPAFAAAGERLGAYFQQVCGISASA